MNSNIRERLECAVSVMDLQEVFNIFEAEIAKARNHDDITDVLENFDFEKVQKVMQALDWTWQNVGIPSISTMKNQVRKMFEKLESSNSKDEYPKCISTGGFRASIIEGSYILEFIAEEYETDDYLE